MLFLLLLGQVFLYPFCPWIKRKLSIVWTGVLKRATLGRMGFKYSFLRWLSLFYTQAQSAVIVNGHISPFFSLSRGVRRGCPLTPLLYVLVAETLGVNIRCNPRSFYERMTQSGLSLIFIPCLRKLRPST